MTEEEHFRTAASLQAEVIFLLSPLLDALGDKELMIEAATLMSAVAYHLRASAGEPDTVH